MAPGPATNQAREAPQQDAAHQEEAVRADVEAAVDKNSHDIETEPAKPPMLTKVGYWGIFKAWAVLGWTAFGGPAAHIGQFLKVFVEQKRWMGDVVFTELLALCQCLPGPASTQLSFAIGITQKGIPGGLLSGILFQYPGLLLMSIVGFGAAEWLVDPEDWLQGVSAGLAAVAVALVASASVLLGKKMCVDRMTTFLCTTAAIITYYYQTQWIFPTLIVVGGLCTLFQKWKHDVSVKETDETVDKLGVSMLGGVALLAVWISVLVTVIIVRKNTSYEDHKFVHWFEAFYTTGSVIYGGGQVVLPILEQQVVHYDTVCAYNGTDTLTQSARICASVESRDTWVTSQQFLAGLAVAQAMPGPLFNFAAYLGAIVGGFPGIVACWLGLFGPGILIIYGVLPFWGKFRKWAIYRKALPGFNATAVGLIWASVFSLGLKAVDISPFPQASVAIGVAGFVTTEYFSVPAPIAIIGGGVLGLIAWATDCK